MYITCQQEMDFGEVHNDAMNRRLHKYFFRSLLQVNPEANQWLRDNAMDCIVWVQKIVATNSTTVQTGRTLGECGDGLESEDIRQILSVSPMDDHAPECSTEGGEISLTNDGESETESDSSDEDEDNNHIDKLRYELEKAVPLGFRQTAQHAPARSSNTAQSHPRSSNHRTSMISSKFRVTSKSQADRLIIACREQQALKDRVERLEMQRQRVMSKRK